MAFWKKNCVVNFFFWGNHCVVNFNVNFNISESDSSPPQYMCYQIMVKCVLLEDLQVDICVSVKWENCLKNGFLKKDLCSNSPFLGVIIVW